MGSVTTFTVVGSQITRQQTGEDEIFFFYDNDGQLIGLNYAADNYFYLKNLQGDIIAIADIDGTIVVEYTYDAWGVLLSTSGTMAGTLGIDNPFRYRGYYYDTETELYYLQSRYYNPSWGRFLNADTTEVCGAHRYNNIYSYARNNPVMIIDPTGMWGIELGEAYSFLGALIMLSYKLKAIKLSHIMEKSIEIEKAERMPDKSGVTRYYFRFMYSMSFGNHEKYSMNFYIGDGPSWERFIKNNWDFSVINLVVSWGMSIGGLFTKDPVTAAVWTCQEKWRRKTPKI